ncbi:polyprenyl synthetase family protein [Baia soyae]|uniref:Farnesyl diphosphate synthase n=1 Tax=Baia soyae TaxID=1544746 RepID=A0A4R2S2Y1_9BACL|nr:farnesyl diphosphate synthase [Baia soyae]TCP69744.1 geranylgeranyl diphosphate synthase type II [Baia soyae]
MPTIRDYIQQKAQLVHEELDTYTSHLTDIPQPLLDSMRYSLLAGGKRIRPVLALATAEAFGVEAERILPFACAVEMIHTYSLIHDDLPSMDDDDYRRGKLTNHKVYGEAMAILAGDALLTEAFGLLADGATQAHLPVHTAMTIVREGADLAGARGMVGGQVSDLLAEDRQIALEDLQSIHKRKTGDLIAYSVRMGARVAGVSPGAMHFLSQFAYGIGLAFQIQDDILDVIGDQEKIGKRVGSDEANHKSTYPSLLGLEESKKKLHHCISQAKIALMNIPDCNPGRLMEIADYLMSRDR